VLQHLPIFENKTILKDAKIKMSCNDCYTNFSWQYAFVTGKKRYTDSFIEYIEKRVPEETVLHCSQTSDVSYSTVERIYKNYVDYIVPKYRKQSYLKVKTPVN
jgi:transposase